MMLGREGFTARTAYGAGPTAHGRRRATSRAPGRSCRCLWDRLRRGRCRRPVDEAPRRRAALLIVERHDRQRAAAIRFPLVDAAGSLCVFLRARDDAAFVEFGAGHLAVAIRGDLHPADAAVWRSIGPRIHLAVVLAREADLLDLLIGGVVLPAIDLAVTVAVDFDPDDAGAVHVAPGVDLPVLLRVELQHRQLPGRLVVDRVEAVLLGGRVGFEEQAVRAAATIVARMTAEIEVRAIASPRDLQAPFSETVCCKPE